MKTAAPIRLPEPQAPPRAMAPVSEAPSALAPSSVPAPALATPAPVRPPSPSPRRRAWLETLTQPRACLLVACLVGILLAYSGFTAANMVRRPSETARLLAASALAGGQAIDPATLDALRLQASQSRSRLLTDRPELHAVLEALETSANQAGWRLEVPLDPPSQLADEEMPLVAYPTSLRLTPLDPKSPRAFGALLTWLETLGQQPKHAEIIALSVTRLPGGSTSVQLDLLLLGTPPHGQASPE